MVRTGLVGIKSNALYNIVSILQTQMHSATLALMACLRAINDRTPSLSSRPLRIPYTSHTTILKLPKPIRPPHNQTATTITVSTLLHPRLN